MFTWSKADLKRNNAMNNIQGFLSTEKYREILDITPVCTVDVLFFNSDKTKTLLFKRENEPVKGTYFSIGGRLLKNELLEDCVVRQTFREIGVKIKKGELAFGGIQEEIHSNSMFEGVSYHAIDIFYGYVLDDEEIKLDSQHSDYKWFSVSDDTLHPFIKTKIASLLKIYGKKF